MTIVLLEMVVVVVVAVEIVIDQGTFRDICFVGHGGGSDSGRGACVWVHAASVDWH